MPDPANHTPRSKIEATESSPLLGIAFRLGAMAVLGVMFALVKLAGAHGVHVVESLFWRQFAGLPVVLGWLLTSGKLYEVKTRHPGAHAARATLGLVSMALNFTAMLLLPMALATTIGFATPIFATLLAALLLAEPTGKYRWGAVVLGFMGVALAMQPGSNIVTGIGPWIALAGALLTACTLIQLRRMSREETTGATVFWFSLSTLLPLGIGMLFFSKSHDLQTWAIIAGLAFSGAVAQLLLTAAVRYASVAAIATMDYSGLIWSVLLGYLIFGDLPTKTTWVGAAIIIGAGLIIIWREQYLAKQRRLLAS
jgi:drug/metabolite transporter (DMT)-like permease